ncbi:Xanthine/uracil/vitamin C permease [Zychaea mexicana]|uniref:Xanthine/uracil/vitamin C permease n=1 Tax=Zychaea mexicana TaxID=64656 RepID=UPI0022FE22A5|nr:Xanthine/uracil/vitamin C permease [Zychaea mexicana]KAI9490018.1 Xanthine/uracil/vitamin C permease [Zychaea mexicana]
MNTSRFYGPNENLPVVLAFVMGIQHFLAVIGGVIAPTMIISGAGSSTLNLPQDLRQYMISASFIVCGVNSIIQIIRFKIYKTRYYIGCGILGITGVAFANLPAAEALISSMYSNGMCPTETLPDGTINYLPCPDAFGAILGTQMVCGVVGVLFSFLPPRVIRKMFPKIVTGTVLFTIGVSLIYSGMKNWAGGSGPCMNRPESGDFALCPTIHAPNPQIWGGAVNFGLGASVFFTIILVELFGSVFMRNIGVAIGLLVGCIIAAGIGMFDGSSIAAAPAGTFLWVRTFNISVYGPGILPFLFTQLDMIIETLGDLTAASDVSGLPIEGKEFEERCQGALLADGLGSIFSALATSMGVVMFTQNNGIIAVTRCASRIAGLVCAAFLIIFGIFGKISAAFLAIPAPLIGGMTVFLFASVAASGIRILSYLEWTRRDRVIVAASLALALGVALVPSWFSNVLPRASDDNPGLQGLYDTVNAIVSTSYILAGLMSVILNLILPYEQGEGEQGKTLVMTGEKRSSLPVAERVTSTHGDEKRSI